MKRYDIVVLSGFSGCGKGTLLQAFLSRNTGFEVIRSYTSRKRRSDDDAYTFVSAEEFLRLREEGFFLESNNYDGQWYGTPLRAVMACIEKGRTAILEIDVHGLSQVLQAPEVEGLKLASVFIVADANRIVERLVNRKTEARDKIISRLGQSMKECDHLAHYDNLLRNDDLDQAVAELEDLLLQGTPPRVCFDGEQYKLHMAQILAGMKAEASGDPESFHGDPSASF